MRPMYDMLRAAAERVSFHMPGHKGKAPFGMADMYALDTTELPLTDDLYAPERGVAQAQEQLKSLETRQTLTNSARFPPTSLQP